MRRALPCLVLLAACAGGDAHDDTAAAAAPPARIFAAGDLRVTGVLVPAPAPGAPGAAYLVIANAGGDADTLVGVESAAAARASVHASVTEGGTTHMERRDAVPVPAGDTVRLEPGGLHVMLEELVAPLAAGDTLPLVLEFRRAGRVPVVAEVVRYADLEARMAATGGSHERH